MNKKKKNAFRKLVGKAHLILGLTTGLVVFIVAITGCLWVFQEEIKSLANNVPTIETKSAPIVTPTEAKKIAQEIFPDNYVHGVLYGDADEAVEVIFFQKKPEEFYRSVYIEPYTKEVLYSENHEAGFFHFILDGHMYLWLPEDIGTEVVRWSTAIFLIMLISGIILWWPKKRKNSKQRFQFVWKKSTAWKRKNYDLHAILGFYVSIIGLLFALTGMVMAFDTVEDAIYKSVGGEKTVKFKVPDNVSDQRIAENPSDLPIDRLIPILKERHPDAELMEVHFPHTDSSSIYVEMTYERGVYYSSDYRFYDQYTLEEIETPSIYGKYAEAAFADKVIRMNYDTHVGAILGLPGKIILFFASLIVASLPLSGFLIWWGRKKKGKKRKLADA